MQSHLWIMLREEIQRVYLESLGSRKVGGESFKNANLFCWGASSSRLVDTGRISDCLIKWLTINCKARHISLKSKRYCFESLSITEHSMLQKDCRSPKLLGFSRFFSFCKWQKHMQSSSFPFKQVSIRLSP